MKRLLLACCALTVLAPAAFAGYDEGLDAYRRKDWTTAFREFQPLAASGHVQAISRLGHMYLHGLGVARNEAEAARLLTQAAEKGDALAQNTLGGLYFYGRGVPRSMDQALVWFLRAADQGQPNALNNLGQFYFNGTGVAKNEAKGVEYLRQAAEKGISASWETLGIAYWHGRGVPKDHAQAVTWLKKAAERGHMVAQNLYGAALWTGDGVAQDRETAIRLFELSGNQGDRSSLFNAGNAYLHGAGVPKDAEKAYYYLSLAEGRALPAEKQRFAEARDKARALLSPEKEREVAQKVAAWKPVKGAPTDLDPDDDGRPGTTGASSAAKPDAAPPRPQHSTGSGFVVGRDGTVLTNSHVVRSCRNIRVTLDGQPSQAAVVTARDAGNDLALLKSSLMPAEVARFREDKPMRSGDGVVAVGFPLSTLLSREPNVTAGVVSALAGLKGDKRHYQITAPIQNGNSGGPVADMSGNVVGVVVSTLNATKIADRIGGAIPQNVNFAIKAELARKFLADNGIAYETAPAASTLGPADVGDILRKVTTFIECEG